MILTELYHLVNTFVISLILQLITLTSVRLLVKVCLKFVLAWMVLLSLVTENGGETEAPQASQACPLRTEVKLHHRSVQADTMDLAQTSPASPTNPADDNHCISLYLFCQGTSQCIRKHFFFPVCFLVVRSHSRPGWL